MSGHLAVIGIGPGEARQMTLEARGAIDAAEMVLGYGPYLARLELRADQVVTASDNREELARASAALELAAAGKRVAVISGGDPGVFAMAAAVCEAIDNGPAEWRDLDLTVIPGISAMLGAAARVGAPLGHDFAVLSLSDNLKPFAVIEQRLAACAAAGLVLALYNPLSRARPHQFERALDVLRGILGNETVVVFARAVGRADEDIRISTLGAARAAMADMATLVIVGSVMTRLVAREGCAPLVYSPRFWPADAPDICGLREDGGSR